MPTPPAKAQGIADEIAAKIRQGDYPPGNWLPSERELSHEHQANRSTIRNAIRLLIREGLVTHVPRQGVRVAEPGATSPATQPSQAEAEISCGPPRCCLTLAGMTAWLASEDRLTLVRVADIASVQVVVPGEPDPRLHPAKRLDRAEEVQVMVGSRAGVTMRAATCPGSDALWAREELLNMVSLLMGTAADNTATYVYAPTSWPRRRPEQAWLVSSRVPDL